MSKHLRKGDLVTVVGGSGFVGRHVVRELAQRGYRVRAAVRRPDLAGHLQPLGRPGQVHAVQANVRFPASIGKAVQGASAVINLVAVLSEAGAQTFSTIHVEGAEAVGRACAEAGISTLIHVSALGADPAAGANYARTRGEGEMSVRASFPDAVVIRPSLVFGPGDALFNRFAAMARLLPALPLIGGKTNFQPVYVGDLASAIVSAAEGDAELGTTYEIGGPEILTMKDIMARTLDYTDRTNPLVTTPFWLAKLKAAFLSLLPNAPLTVDQVRMLEHDNVVSEQAEAEGRTLAALGIKHPTPVELIVPEYLERFSPRGQYAHYRA